MRRLASASRLIDDVLYRPLRSLPRLNVAAENDWGTPRGSRPPPFLLPLMERFEWLVTFPRRLPCRTTSQAICQWPCAPCHVRSRPFRMTRRQRVGAPDVSTLRQPASLPRAFGLHVKACCVLPLGRLAGGDDSAETVAHFGITIGESCNRTVPSVSTLIRGVFCFKNRSIALCGTAHVRVQISRHLRTTPT